MRLLKSELDAANKKVCFALLYFNCMRAFKASDVVCVSACVSVARACVRRACVCVGASVCACVCMRVCVQVLQYFTCRINHTFFLSSSSSLDGRGDERA